MEKQERTCANCVHYTVKTKEHDPKTKERSSGDCRRYPPTILSQFHPLQHKLTGEGIPNWLMEAHYPPVSSATGACGEFKPIGGS